MSSIFGGGTSKASRESVANQQAANAATQRFIEQQTGRARSDVSSLFPQADTARNLGFQGALDIIGAGINPQIAAFTQGNVGAQNIVNQGMGGFQNAILGLPIGSFAPQTVSVDTSFLSNPQMPAFAQVALPQQVQPPPQPTLGGPILQNLGGGGRNVNSGILGGLAWR